MFERWRWDEPEHTDQFTGKGFVAIDPGKEGAALAFRAGEKKPALMCAPEQPVELFKLVRDVDAAVIILEAQYVTHLKMARSIVELSFKTGIALGWVACSRHPLHVTNLIEVAPATWQAHQRHNVGAQPGRGQGIAIAKARAKSFAAGCPLFALWWQASTADVKEGLASALGLADWWLSK